jgi:hypothetical protein
MQKTLGIALFGLVALYAVPAAIGWWQDPYHVFLGRRDGWWDGDDFAVFYSAGRLIAHGQFTSLYDASAHIHANKELAYYNPPFFALFFAPLSLLSEERAFQVWTVGSLLLLAFNAWLVWRIAEPLDHVWRATLVIAFVSLYPVTWSLRLGQFTLILVASWALAFLYLRQRRDRAAGFALTPLLIKPELLIPVTLFLVWKRRWDALRPLFGITVLAIVASIAIITPAGAWQYASHIRESAAAGTGSMYGWNGLLAATFSPGRPGEWTSLATLLAIASLAGVACLWRGPLDATSDRFPLQWFALTLATVLSDVHLYLQDLLLLVPAAVALLATSSGWRRYATGAAITLGWVILGLGNSPTLRWEINLFALYIAVCLVALIAWDLLARLRAPKPVLTPRPPSRRWREAFVRTLDIEHSGPVVRATVGALRSGPARALGRGLAKTPFLAAAYVGFVVATALHGLVRGIADEFAPFGPLNTAEFDRVLFLGTVPSVWLQDVLGTGRMWTLPAFLIWQTLFWVPIVLIGLAAIVQGKRGYLQLLALHCAIIFSADVIYAIAATKPPWMDVEAARLIAIHSPVVNSLDRNAFAALPSLHVAVPFAYALWYVRQPNRHLHRLGIALVVWTTGVAWSIVYTGEHYVLDVVTGLVWSALCYAVLARTGVLERHRVELTVAPQPPASVPLPVAPPAERAA